MPREHRAFSTRAVLNVAVLCLASPPALAAQRGCDTLQTGRLSVAADLEKRRLEGALPFNVRFELRVPIPTIVVKTPTAKDTVVKLDSLQLVYGPAAQSGNSFGIGTVVDRLSWRRTPGIEAKEFGFRIQPLRSGETYYFEFTPFYRDTARQTVRLAGQPRSDIANHIETDIGVLSSDRARYQGVESAAHFYLRPMHPNECTADYRGLDHVFKRVSIFVGVSVLKIHSRAEVDHLYAGGSPIVGIGVSRLPFLGPLRINGGVIFLKQKDPDPLVSRDRGRRDLFLGVATDVSIRSLVTPLVALAGLK